MPPGGATMTTKSQFSPQTKTHKRPRELSIAIVDARPAKKNCRLDIGSVSIPKNDAKTYVAELRTCLFYTFCPLDRTNIQKAKRRGYFDRVSYGLYGNHIVERLILDKETKVPWQVPKVTVEYKKIDYITGTQEYTIQSQEDEGEPVSPTTLPAPDQMSRSEYDAALAVGDASVAVEGQHLFEYCIEADVGWLQYRDR